MSFKISVLMSVFDEKNNFLEEAINSILQQTFTDFEFIIIDDRTNIENKKILNFYQKKDQRIKIINNNKNLGLTRSLNKGIYQSNGLYLARMDSDDVALPDRLKKQYEFLKKNNSYIGCGTLVSFMDEKNKIINKKNHPTSYKDITKSILRYNPFIHPTLMIKKNILLSLGGYDENFYFAQDYDLVLRILSKYKMTNIKEKLLCYRVNINGLSHQNMRKSLKFALWARWRALMEKNYPLWKIIYLIKPAFSLLIPENIKIILLKKIYSK